MFCIIFTGLFMFVFFATVSCKTPPLMLFNMAVLMSREQNLSPGFQVTRVSLQKKGLKCLFSMGFKLYLHVFIYNNIPLAADEFL